MTQEQAAAQVQMELASARKALELQQAQQEALGDVIEGMESDYEMLSNVLGINITQATAGYVKTLKAEKDQIVLSLQNRIEQLAGVLAQLKSPILVPRPGGAGPMPGGGIRMV
jgi:hypothetical protein